jgi:hypothetical protein
MGFTGDIDDLEEDEQENEIADNDDWMFQTFQKGIKEKKNDSKVLDLHVEESKRNYAYAPVHNYIRV